MTRLTMIFLFLAAFAVGLWTGYVCGRDSAQFDYEQQLDMLEGLQK